MELDTAMDTFRRRRDLIKRTSLAANVQAADQSQSSQDSYYDAPEPSSHNEVRDIAEESQSYDDYLHYSPEPFSSSPPPDINTPDETQLSDDCCQPLELIPTSPVLDATEHLQSNNESVHPPELLSSSPVMNTHHHVELREESYYLPGCDSNLQTLDAAQRSQCIDEFFDQPRGPISTSPVLDTTQHLQSNGESLDLPEHILSSPGIIAPEDNRLWDEFQQELDSGSDSQTVDAAEQLQCVEDYIHQAQKPSSTPRVVDDSESPYYNKDSLHPIGRIYSPRPSDAPEDTVSSDKHSQHSLEAASNLLALNTPKNTQTSDGVHQQLALGSISQFLHPIEQTYPINKSFPQLPQSISNSVLDSAQQLPTNYDDSELFSSSPGVEIPDCTVSSDGQSAASPERMAISSLVDTSNDSRFSDGSLHQSLELILASPNPPVSEQPQLGYHPLYRGPEIIAPIPITTPTATQPQFIDDYLQESLEVVPTSLVADAVSASPSGCEEDDDNISALEYARKNEISCDYLNEPYTSNLKLFGDHEDGITDDSHLQHFDLIANVNIDERLTISKDAALLIASVSREETSDWIDSTMLQMIWVRKRGNLRIELPLLKTDHETDCKKFAQKEDLEIKLQDVKLPLEMVNEGNNGGLRFSSSLWSKGDDILENLKREKLEVSKDTLVYLQNMLKNDWTEQDEKALWTSIQIYKKNSALEPVTPPLSPMTFSNQRYEPSMSDPVFEVPILSDPESLTKQDLEAIENKAYAEDVPTPIKNARDNHDASSETLIGSPVVKLADLYSPAASLDRDPVYPEIEQKRFKCEELKVEEPLTPSKPNELPKSIRFTDRVMECPIVAGSPPTDSFQSSCFEEAFGDAYQKATQMSEQEALNPADTMARVQVPIMDFSLPSPPWKITQSNLHSSSLLDLQEAAMKNSIGHGLPKWPLNGKLKVRYNPFPHDFAKVALEEDFIVDDATWKAFVKGPGDDDIIDTSALTWKPPGLRILGDDEDDNEIELGNFEMGPHPDIAYLVKKRKMEIEQRGSDENPAVQDDPATTLKQLPRKKTPKTTDIISAGRKLQSDRATKEGGSLLMGGAFSVENSVENFLEIRGTKKPKLGDSPYFAKPLGQANFHQTPAKANPQLELLLQLPIRNSPVPKTPTPLPAPPNKIPNTPVNVIVASSLLKHRRLIKHIESSFPGIVLVERDFAAHNTTTWMPGSVARSPIASPLASEADIIVSPLVGIVIANLQKIKQKPLPGQKTKSAIRERLETVSARYEKLLVLVTEGRQDESTRELDDSDCIAFSEFVGFSLCLQTTVSVQFVGGGEAMLAKWLVNAIAQHKTDEELLGDETHWELFLRRAGLNAFTAQHIISSLKAPDGVDLFSPSKAAHFGLAAFVEMGREQRIAKFGPVCGNRLMARVSAVVDTKWS